MNLYDSYSEMSSLPISVGDSESFPMSPMVNFNKQSPVLCSQHNLGSLERLMGDVLSRTAYFEPYRTRTNVREISMLHASKLMGDELYCLQ